MVDAELRVLRQPRVRSLNRALGRLRAGFRRVVVLAVAIHGGPGPGLTGRHRVRVRPQGEAGGHGGPGTRSEPSCSPRVQEDRRAEVSHRVHAVVASRLDARSPECRPPDPIAEAFPVECRARGAGEDERRRDRRTIERLPRRGDLTARCRLMTDARSAHRAAAGSPSPASAPRPLPARSGRGVVRSRETWRSPP